MPEPGRVLTREELENWSLDLSHVALRKTALHYLYRLAETERERDTAFGVNKVRKRFDRDLISENERLARSHEQLREIMRAYLVAVGRAPGNRDEEEVRLATAALVHAASLSAGYNDELNERLTRADAGLAAAREAIRAYAANYPCPGLLVAPGATSGCDPSSGADDCPTCHEREKAHADE